MIPTVAFGVPGSVSTAILLGAFLIQGLVPGPQMLTPEAKGGHLSLTFSFVWIIVVSNIITRRSAFCSWRRSPGSPRCEAAWCFRSSCC